MLRKQETRSARYFGRALLRFYWERRRNMYDKTDIEGVPFFWDRMNIKDNVPMDKLHGIGSDTAWDVLLTRKPEKYEKWI